MAGASLVAPWSGILPPVQDAWVWSLIQEDRTCHRATEPVHHSYWAWAPEPGRRRCWACTPWSRCSATWGGTAARCLRITWRVAFARATREKPAQQWRLSTDKNRQTNIYIYKKKNLSQKKKKWWNIWEKIHLWALHPESHCFYPVLSPLSLLLPLSVRRLCLTLLVRHGFWWKGSIKVPFEEAEGLWVRSGHMSCAELQPTPQPSPWC